ncbi:MAG: alpha/beta hydrolase-fold protein [Planctomycetes bacterium]|nr:alpha/beta hydrolase-fold protein [Planctomycetota bacterium]
MRVVRTWPALALLLFVTRAGADPSTPQDVARALDAGRLEPAAAARAWGDAGLTPADAAALLQAAPSAPALRPGEHTLELVDPHGVRTDLIVVVPEAPLADGRYGLLVSLHGLRGDARQLMPFARRIAPPGFIVASPTAQHLPPEREAEDGALLSQAFGLAGAGEDDGGEGPDAERRRRLRRLAEGAQRGALPHWWGYEHDGFPLLAVDEVRRRAAVDPDRVLLLGYSMGGYGTWNAGLRHPDRFAGIAPLAGGISRREMVLPRDDRMRHVLGNARMLPSFFVHGSADRVVPARFSRTIAEDLAALGAAHVYEEVEGGGHILMRFLQGDQVSDRLEAWLAARVREAHPRRVVHHALSPAHGDAWWVRVERVDGPARVEAEALEGNRIVVATEGVRRLTVRLDPALVDPAASVRIEVDGEVVHDGPVPATLEAVAGSFAARRDPSLVFERAVTIDLPRRAPAPPAPQAPRQF